MLLTRYKFLTILLVLLIQSPHVHANFNECDKPLTLSSTTDWYPYIYKDEAGESQGVDIELLSKILKIMGCQLKVAQFPERRSLFELGQGNFDIGLGASKNIERMKKFHYSTMYRNEVNKFVYRLSDNDIAYSTTLKELLNMNKSIAINLAGWYGYELEQAKADFNNFIYSDTVGKRLKMLNYNRVDIVVDDEVVLCSELARLTYTGMTIHSTILYEASIHFIFNKINISEKFVKEFNLILDSMRTDGRLEELFYQSLPASCQLK